MSSGLPSLYRRGTDVFGGRKTPLPYNKPNMEFTTSLPPLSSVNDLLAIGRDEIASMKNLKDSLKCIKKLNNSSRLQRHKVKRNPKITSKEIEMFLDSEQAFYIDDTENDEDNYEEQVEQEQRNQAEDGNDIESENPSFEEEEAESDIGLSDLISLINEEFNSDEVHEQNAAESNHAESINDDNINDSHTSSSQNNTNFISSNNLNAFAILQQNSLEDESNIHQIDDALSFVSSIVCNNLENSASTSNSNSPLISPSISISNSRSNSALVSPRNQGSRNNSARSSRSNINQQTENTD